MPNFFGLCGRVAPTPCRLAWASSYPNKVGVYPSQFLPSKRTAYHAASDGGYNFRPPIVTGGQTFGLPFGGIIGGFDQFGPPQFDTFTPQSHIATIFAQTANRFNVSHIITQAEITEASANGGVALINVGEYVFEFLAVTDQKEVTEASLTPAEIEALETSGESESDRIFRKLFESPIPTSRNRFLNIELNKRGIEYRFDNGSPQVNSALKLAGIGDLINPSYRDGSSKIIRVDLKKITERLPLKPGDPAPAPGSLQAVAREPKVGDIIYFSYIAIKEHYFRQSVEASYTIQAMSVPPQAFGIATKVLVANYRFYEWSIKTTGSTIPTKLAGWRIVESFNIPTNVISTIKRGSQIVLGQIPITKGQGVVSINVLDTRNITDTLLDEYIADRAAANRNSTYSMNLNQSFFNANYHDQEDQSYKKSIWYTSGNLPENTGYTEVIQHVFYNTHPLAMNKRDVDKWGIERFLAQKIETDIKNGKDTFFPFMDDVVAVNPTENPIILEDFSSGSLKFLSSQNAKFEPIQPISRYTAANLEIEAGVAGSVQVGNTGSTDDIVAVFNFASNIITEKLAENTRILAERHFTVGQRGIRTLAVEGLGGKTSAISCICDPLGVYSFAAHTNQDAFLTVNKFFNSHINDGFRKLKYRPDITSSLDLENPLPNQFPSLLGYGGLLGDLPGIYPGTIISTSNYADLSSFNYKTTNRDQLLLDIPGVSGDRVQEISVNQSDGKISIDLGNGYFGRTEIGYTCSRLTGVETLFLFKSGNTIDSVIESVFFQYSGLKQTLAIPHYWIKGGLLEIVGDGVNDISIRDITIQQLDPAKANDFLEDGNSSVSTDKNGVTNGNFITRNLFFETDAMSIGEDKKSRVIIFFNDKNGGISAVQSNDFGRSWFFHYGIVEAFNVSDCRDPFVLSSVEQNGCFLFFNVLGKIVCKFLPFEMFRFEDALLVQKFETDIVNRDGEVATINNDVFSEIAVQLRRNTIAYAAGGDLTDTVFRQLTGRNPDTNVLEDTEPQTSGSVEMTGIKEPYAIGPGTAFVNRDITDFYFSAFRNDEGAMKLFFLSTAKGSIGGGQQLQCNVSFNNGQTWYDYWEWIEYGFNRLRTDSETRTQFIDRAANGAAPTTIESTDPNASNEEMSFGINVHWSRLAKHKSGEPSVDADSTVLEVTSPYVFYQSVSNQVFLFYIYESCLLCKIFNDDVFSEAAKSKRETGIGGMTDVKTQIEKSTRAYFVDGDLSSADIREELHRYYNAESAEVMSDGNIVFQTQWGLPSFTSSRRITTQRVCAYELPDGGVRVFYKHENSQGLKSAIWTGSLWIIDDLLKDTTLPMPILTVDESFAEVCGGFSGTGFECSLGLQLI